MSPEYLGQHFLVNRSIARKMVAMLCPGNTSILEIGAGKGILSELLLEFYPEHRIVLVELDSQLHSRLSHTFGSRCRVLRDSILNVRLARLPFSGKFSLIGNIPYYLSKEIINWSIAESGSVRKGIFMLQKEFADKLITPPPGKSNSQHIMFRHCFRSEKVMQIRPGSFSPPPKVLSTIFSFKRQPRNPRIPDEPEFYRFLQACFASRRKTLANNLSTRYGKAAVENIFGRPGISILSRAEQLDLNDFIWIFLSITGRTSETAGRR